LNLRLRGATSIARISAIGAGASWKDHHELMTVPAFLRASLAAALALTALSACAPTLSERGYFPDPTKTQAIGIGVDTKETIADRLGTPTFESPFNPDVWYYVSQTQEKVSWHEPHVTGEKVIVVKFDDNDRVKSVGHLNQSAMHDVVLVKRTTPTLGHKLSIWEQLFGSIGRLPAGQRQQSPGH
jgi:outer membrane protein assembly factor BamE (lipoprotein component of BamABCDE complex)